jgi:CheY-like chemotaxis protein
MNQRPRTVLVVDDQEDERVIQRAMLGHLGYAVHEAADGESGLRLAHDLCPDLVLLDVAMPRMDGLSVCRALRADAVTANIPIVLFTASVTGDLDEMAREAGADAILTKPIEPHRVAEIIAGLIGPA